MTVLELPTPDPRTLDEDVRPFAEALSDRYALRRLIGSGGMGRVYLARDKRLDRLVAIKTLPPHLANDRTVRERFLRETRTAGGMAHPNIVPVHGADEANGHLYFVMAFVPGESLAALVTRMGRLEPATVVRHLREVALALGHAHERGIIHRDIKAENILIDADSGRALVTDFGVSRLADASPLTATGQVLGSVHYVSPEQVTAGTADARSDIYSLGVVGYLALSGQFPFDAEVASAVMVQHVIRAATPVALVSPDVPAALAAVIDRCLAKDPAGRYASAHAVVEALDALHLIPASDPHARAAESRTVRPTHDVRIPDEEAKLVWQRAAELQAATGLRPRPHIVPMARDDRADAERMAGFTVADVRGAARDAGITEEYVDHALGERGLVAVPGASAAAVVRPAARDASLAARGAWWTGVPLHVAETARADGALPAGSLVPLIHLLRDSTGQLGHADEHARDLFWWTGRQGARTEVTVVPDASGTSVQVSRDLRRSALLRSAAALGVSVLAVGPSVLSLTLEALSVSEDAAIVTTLAAVAVSTWRGSRWLIRRAHDRVSREARALAERVAAQIERAP